jgi:hypothetical protein
MAEQNQGQRGTQAPGSQPNNTGQPSQAGQGKQQQLRSAESQQPQQGKPPAGKPKG